MDEAIEELDEEIEARRARVQSTLDGFDERDFRVAFREVNQPSLGMAND
ncbi:MAG: HalX domain-containing protein [Halobacteriaceae archaeon]